MSRRPENYSSLADRGNRRLWKPAGDIARKFGDGRMIEDCVGTELHAEPLFQGNQKENRHSGIHAEARELRLRIDTARRQFQGLGQIIGAPPSDVKFSRIEVLHSSTPSMIRAPTPPRR